jgi:hypothetical protein
MKTTLALRVWSVLEGNEMDSGLADTGDRMWLADTRHTEEDRLNKTWCKTATDADKWVYELLIKIDHERPPSKS